MKIERKSNFELLRIISMFMIIMVHTLGHGGAIEKTFLNNYNFFIVNFLESFSIIGVNCYIIISGYFNIMSEFKVSKIFKIYLQTIFYSIVISIIFMGVGLTKINLKNLLFTFFPIMMQTWWFVSIFLVLYIFSYYINKLLKNLSFDEYTKLVIIMSFIFVVWPSIPKFAPIDNQSGYSLYNFIFLYIIGAYIKLFFEDKHINKLILINSFIILGMTLSIINIAMSFSYGYYFAKNSYNFIIVVIMSVMFFLIFKQINIKNKFVNKVASLTFGIYLIHDHPFVRDNLYKWLNYNDYFNKSTFFIYTLFIVLIIYFFSSLIELFRKKIFSFFMR